MADVLNEKIENDFGGDRETLHEDTLIPLGGIVTSGLMSMSMTLWIRGQMITGTMVDRDTYGAAVIQAFKGSTNAIAHTIVTTITTEKQQRIDAQGKHRDRGMGEFIYLIDVYIYTPNGWIRPNNSCWKGRVSSIDGFMYGTVHT